MKLFRRLDGTVIDGRSEVSHTPTNAVLCWVVPVEPGYDAAWKAWKATGNIEDAVDAALGIGGDDG